MAIVLMCLLVPWSKGASAEIHAQHSSRSNLRTPEVVLLFTAATALLYWPTVSLGLFSDDFALAEWARAGDFATKQWLQFRPFPLWVWSTIFTVVGNDSIWLHLLSIALHAANGTMVVLLARRIGLADPDGLLAGALFVTLPVTVEAVVWPAGSHDLWMTLGCLTFVLLASVQRRSWPLLIGGAASLAIALLSKETGVVTPLLAALLWFRGRSSLRHAGLQMTMVGFVACAGYAIWRTSSPASAELYSLAPSRYLVKEVLVRPFASLGAPWSEAVAASWPVVPLLSVWLLLLLSVFNAAHWEVRDDYWRSVRLMLWVLAAVLPVFPFLFIGPSLEGGRYLYLPACGWSVLLAILFSNISRRSTRLHRMVPPALAVAVVVLLGLGIRWHLQPWQEAATLRDAVLQQALRALAQAECSAVAFEDIPNSHNGAYVFRNGFEEALRLEGAHVEAIVDDDARADCTFRWTDRKFVQERFGRPRD